METLAHCLYPSKPYTKSPSLKNDGKLHRVGIIHRVKANDPQRRWHARRKDTSDASPSLSPALSDSENDITASKPVGTKRIRSSVLKKPANSSESGSSTFMMPMRRRRCKLTALAEPSPPFAATSTTLAPLPPMSLSGLLTSSTQLETGSSVMSDGDLALLCSFLGELEEAKLHIEFNLTSDSMAPQWK